MRALLIGIFTIAIASAQTQLTIYNQNFAHGQRRGASSQLQRGENEIPRQPTSPPTSNRSPSCCAT